MIQSYYEKNKESILKKRKLRYPNLHKYIFNQDSQLNQKHKKYMKNWRKINQDKETERYEKEKEIIYIRNRTRKLFPINCPCENCNSKQNLERHHIKYQLPINREDFLILCNKCHTNLHNLQRGKKGYKIGSLADD